MQEFYLRVLFSSESPENNLISLEMNAIMFLMSDLTKQQTIKYYNNVIIQEIFIYILGKIYV